MPTAGLCADAGQCAACRHQVSLTSGTILHNTKTPLTLWFWAAYLMTTDKRGGSALLLQRQLGLRRNETAWMMLHKLRRAIVNVAREPLPGKVEIDDTWVGGTQAGIPREPSAQGALAQQVLKKIVRLASVFPSPPFRSSDFAGPRRPRLYGFHTGTPGHPEPFESQGARAAKRWT